MERGQSFTFGTPRWPDYVLSNKFKFYNKPEFTPSVIKFVGRGTAVVNGAEWDRHRSLINPAFTLDKLKSMMKDMAAITTSMLEGWKNRATKTEDQCEMIEIDMHEEFRNLTADIIAHIAFRSSYVDGREAFKAQTELQHCIAASCADIFTPGSQYLPTPMNFRIRKLNRKVQDTIRTIIQNRLKNVQVNGSRSGSDRYGYDLLDILILSSDMVQTTDGPKFNMDEIIEECKSIFLTGKETTANLLTWTAYLLSVHKEWEEKLREEVMNECRMEIPDADALSKLKLVIQYILLIFRMEIPDADALSKLKLVNMVLLEALRLYSPAVELPRTGLENMKFGNLIIPKNASVTIPILMIHRSKKYWGEDANEFNPLRFKDGTSKASKHPNAMSPFGLGPGTCVGQTLALLEAKIVIAMILRKFTFSLAPE